MRKTANFAHHSDNKMQDIKLRLAWFQSHRSRFLLQIRQWHACPFAILRSEIKNEITKCHYLIVVRCYDKQWSLNAIWRQWRYENYTDRMNERTKKVLNKYENGCAKLFTLWFQAWIRRIDDAISGRIMNETTNSEQKTQPNQDPCSSKCIRHNCSMKRCQGPIIMHGNANHSHTIERSLFNSLAQVIRMSFILHV